MKMTLRVLSIIAFTAFQLLGQVEKVRLESLPKTFNVSKIGDDSGKKELFKKLWRRLQEHDPEAKRMHYTILQVIGQKKGGTMYRVKLRDRTEAALLLKNDSLLENTTDFAEVVRDGVWDGTTVMGASRRLPIYKEIEPGVNPNAPTKDEFLAALKSGKTYTVMLTDGPADQIWILSW